MLCEVVKRIEVIQIQEHVFVMTAIMLGLGVSGEFLAKNR